jgi:hypothetical protein
MENNEILFSEIVKYEDENIRLSIMNGKIILEKKKGFIKKYYKTIEIISIDEIDTVMTKTNKSEIIIKLQNKKIVVECQNSFDKKRIIEEIDKIKNKKKKIRFNGEKLERIIELLNKTSEVLTITANIIVRIKDFMDKRD